LEQNEFNNVSLSFDDNKE